MSCKYPKESRMHYACILCDEICKDTITSLPLTDSNIPMPEVQPPKCIWRILTAGFAEQNGRNAKLNGRITFDY